MIESENSVAAAELAPSAPALDERAAGPAGDTLPPFRPAPQPTGAWKRRWALGIGGWGAGRNGGSVSSAGARRARRGAGALGASSAAATLFSLSIIQSPRRLRSAPVPASPPTPE